MLAVIGKKLDQTQRFLEDGTRIPVTRIDVPGNVVVDIKTREKNNYSAVALGYGTNPKNKKKSTLGISKKAKLDTAPRTIKEIKIEDENHSLELGTIIKVDEVFAPGDIIQVTGVSKGKGFAGGVKRYHFRGGPKTHGQSDRHRAPGSIGQGTTPGRVYKGKRMAGNMGHQKVTVKNLKVISIEGDILLVSGLVPGPANNILVIKKIGELGKKFIPLTKTQEQLDAEEKAHKEEEARLAKEAEEQAKLLAEEDEKAAQAPEEESQATDAEVKVEEKPEEANTDEVSAEVSTPSEDTESTKKVASTQEETPKDFTIDTSNDKKEEKEEVNGTK